MKKHILIFLRLKCKEIWSALTDFGIAIGIGAAVAAVMYAVVGVPGLILMAVTDAPYSICVDVMIVCFGVPVIAATWMAVLAVVAKRWIQANWKKAKEIASVEERIRPRLHATKPNKDPFDDAEEQF